MFKKFYLVKKRSIINLIVLEVSVVATIVEHTVAATIATTTGLLVLGLLALFLFFLFCFEVVGLSYVQGLFFWLFSKVYFWYALWFGVCWVVVVKVEQLFSVLVVVKGAVL
jgi:hypothetical protein